MFLSRLLPLALSQMWEVTDLFCLFLSFSLHVLLCQFRTLLSAVLHLPEGRLKHSNLCTLLVSSAFGRLFLARLLSLLVLGREKPGSSRALSDVSGRRACKVSSRHLQSCPVRGGRPSSVLQGSSTSSCSLERSRAEQSGIKGGTQVSAVLAEV